MLPELRSLARGSRSAEVLVWVVLGCSSYTIGTTAEPHFIGVALSLLITFAVVWIHLQLFMRAMFCKNRISEWRERLTDRVAFQLYAREFRGGGRVDAESVWRQAGKEAVEDIKMHDDSESWSMLDISEKSKFLGLFAVQAAIAAVVCLLPAFLASR